ncbi:serine hydrolase domain-containing protein [Flavobacterium sp. NRK F7]|uniref:serine hydrolase domain-containing protein n=1 Tax=Flavobacterium sp. NRK F7 TaxID=2954930 RepID=UPI002090027D|nr:serine hydrolase domain-containing protein [Flavobacterium sp. NRK F7]MCO6163497.1 beta-lactamase family protein [Flavobacterium sp. NRK F7]
MKYLITLLLMVFTGSLLGQTLTNELQQEIQRRVSLQINPSIAIGVLLPDNTTQFYNFGSINESNKQPDSLTLYEIGSVTKTFTATLTSIHLKDALHTFLPEYFSKIKNPRLDSIAIFNIRNHTAGLPRLSNQFTPKNWSDPFHGYSNAILEAELRQLQTDTSYTWRYSNLGYSILGRTLELATHKSYETLMGNLLETIGMKNTLLQVPQQQLDNFAQPTNIGTTNSHWHFTGPSRYAGGLVSNTQDLLLYLKYQKETNPLFLPNLLNQLIPTGVPNLGKDKLFYKEGWFVLTPDETTQIVLHNGGTGGYISFIGFNKKTQVGVVVLSNSVTVVDDLGIAILHPSFSLFHPERTIAYELAAAIDNGDTMELFEKYNKFKKENYPQNIIDIYWLERFHFGKGNYRISNQLSAIMMQELPDDWEVYDIRGQNLEQLAKYDEAITAYEKAYTMHSENEVIKEKIKRCKAKLKQ